MRQYVKAHFHLGSDLKALIQEGWEQISQKNINEMVDSMIVRMQDTIACIGLDD